MSNCLHCKHWKRSSKQGDYWGSADEWSNGICKRFPPVVCYNKILGKGTSEWPEITGGDHCGEFSAKEE